MGGELLSTVLLLLFLLITVQVFLVYDVGDIFLVYEYDDIIFIM